MQTLWNASKTNGPSKPVCINVDFVCLCPPIFLLCTRVIPVNVSVERCLCINMRTN